MSLARINNSRRLMEEDPCNKTYNALIGEEMSFFAAQKERVEAALAEKKAAEEKNEALAKKIAALKAAIAEKEAQMPPPKDAIRNIDDLRVFCHEYERLMKEFLQRKQTLTRVLSYTAADFKQADLSVVSRWLDTWGPFLSEADDACRTLKRRERNTPGASLYVPPTRELSSLLDDVCHLQLQARSLVGRERYRRSAYSSDSVEDFLGNQQQLLEWCQKQRQTLDGLSTLEDLNEFGHSFHANVPVMDSNFLVLSEQCEVLAENARVQDAMQEVNAAWIDLCLTTYEKIRAAARDEHKSSGVEEVCAAWVQKVAPQARQFIEQVKKTLSDDDEEVAGAPDAKKILKRCEKMLQELEAHEIVSIHLADFDVREDCVEPHYEALRRELRSDVTATVVSFPCAVEYEGRLEYKNRIEEMREWVDVKSQKGTYLKLLERLEDTKGMIEEYADALFPEDDASTE